MIVLQGTPLLGVLFTVDELTRATVGSVLLFALAGVLLMSNVFCFNDWAGAVSDSKDPDKRRGSFLNKGVSRREMLVLSLVLGSASVALFSCLSLRISILALAIIALSTLYSHPRLNCKERPVLSSLLHVAGGVLHFSMGYSLFGTELSGAIAIGAYFGIVFAAGHLNQEVRDHDGDRGNGLRTNAIAFRKRPVFLASFVLFSLSYGYLFALARTGSCPPAFQLIVLLYPVHAVLFWRTLRAGLTFRSVTRFQASYRALHALIGLIMVGALVA